MVLRRLGLSGALAIVTFLVSFGFSYGPDAFRMSLPSALAISLAASVAVWLSSRRPVAALWVVSLLSLSLPLIRSTFAVMDLVVVFVVFQVAMTTQVRIWVLTVVCFVALTVNDVWQRIAFNEEFLQPSLLYPAVLTALSIGLGVQSRRLRDADRQNALLDERRRIARELHDVAAHHLSALVVRNKVARRMNTREALDEASSFTAQTAATALNALRGVVHVLNTDASAPRTPQPAMADLDEIVLRMQAAGLQIDRTSDGDLKVGSQTELAVVRIVQEALANVLMHRGPGRCWLTIAQQNGSIEVIIEDDGPPMRGSLDAGESGRHQPGNYGLLGMKERAEACGGQLVVGPSPKGGWLVSALLPADGQ